MYVAITWQYQGLLKEKLLLKREIVLNQASRDDTGPAVSGRRPVIVTFENFKWVFSLLIRWESLLAGAGTATLSCGELRFWRSRAFTWQKTSARASEKSGQISPSIKKQLRERFISYVQVHANLEEAEPWLLLPPPIWQVIHWQQALCLGQRVRRGEVIW